MPCYPCVYVCDGKQLHASLKTEGGKKGGGEGGGAGEGGKGLR